MENIYQANSNWKKIKALKKGTIDVVIVISQDLDLRAKDSNMDKTIINSSKQHEP